MQNFKLSMDSVIPLAFLIVSSWQAFENVQDQFANLCYSLKISSCNSFSVWLRFPSKNLISWGSKHIFLAFTILPPSILMNSDMPGSFILVIFFVQLGFQVVKSIKTLILTP